MSEHRYLHSVEKDEVEFDRQKIQAGVYDPVTARATTFFLRSSHHWRLRCMTNAPLP
jgi:hypothetical protein